MKHVLFLLFLFSSALSATSQDMWHPIESNTDQNLRCIDFVTDDIGYIAGDNVLLKTIDGGLSWSEVGIDSIPVIDQQPWTAFDIDFFSETHGRMMLGQWGGLVETFDGGANWSSMTPASSGFCQFGSFYWINAENGVAGGAGCFESAIIDTYENGQWSTTSIPPIFDTNDLVTAITFSGEQDGLAVTDVGRILSTTDGGQVWDSISLNPNINNGFPFSLTDVAYRTADSAYATFTTENGFGVLLSTDGGATWGVDWGSATFFYPDMHAVHFDGNGKAYIAGEYSFDDTLGIVYDETPDFWNYTTLDEPIRDIASHSDSITFLVGHSGAIYVNVEPGTLSLFDHSSTSPFSVYPNPAISSVDIQLVDATDRILDIQVLDIHGTKVGHYQESDRSTARVDLSGLASGIYLIDVRTDKGSTVQEVVKE